MTATPELLANAGRSLRRTVLWWTVGVVTLALVNVAFWPSLEGSDALDAFDDAGELLEAFGAKDMTSAGGYLDAQLFALMLPLLLSGLAIAVVSGLTAGDEDAGRLELLHALPVRRASIWLTRAVAAAGAVLVVAAATALAVAATLRPFSLDEVSPWRVVGATAAAWVLALFHGSVAYAAAGLGASRGRAAALAVVVLVAGYVVAVLLPLASSLDGAERLSPWWWSLGDRPVAGGVGLAGLGLTVALAGALAAMGTAGVERRDIRTP